MRTHESYLSLLSGTMSWTLQSKGRRVVVGVVDSGTRLGVLGVRLLGCRLLSLGRRLSC